MILITFIKIIILSFKCMSFMCASLIQLEMLIQAGADMLMPVAVDGAVGTVVDYAYSSFSRVLHFAAERCFLFNSIYVFTPPCKFLPPFPPPRTFIFPGPHSMLWTLRRGKSLKHGSSYWEWWWICWGQHFTRKKQNM